MADHQILFNIVVGMLGVIGGWWINAMWASIKELQAMDRDLAEKVGAIEVLVAGQYVSRDEYTNTLNAIFVKLDRIQETINSKADK